MSANINTNGGKLLKPLRTPDFRKYAVEVKTPGDNMKQDMIELSKYIRDVIAFPKNKKARDVLMGAPSNVSEQQLKDVHICVKE